MSATIRDHQQPELFGPRDGITFDPERDTRPLNKQAQDVWDALMGGEGWLSLRTLAQITTHPEASISARLRDFRKPRFGGHVVEKRRHPWRERQYVYRLVPRDQCPGENA